MNTCLSNTYFFFLCLMAFWGLMMVLLQFYKEISKDAPNKSNVEPETSVDDSLDPTLNVYLGYSGSSIEAGDSPSEHCTKGDK